jgi:hypothetical protein
MYHVYTEKDYSEFSKTLIGEFTDLEEAMTKARTAIENKPELRYIVEETDGHVNNYGELITTVVAESD